MIATIVGALVSAGLAFFGWWIKWKSNKARDEKARRIAAEERAKDLKEGLAETYRANAENEEKLLEIMSPDLSDDRASELLSRPIEVGKISDPTGAKN